MFLTITSIFTLLCLIIGNAEYFEVENNDFFFNDIVNKNEISEKQQFIGNINENDVIKGILKINNNIVVKKNFTLKCSLDVSKFLDYLSENRLNKRKSKKLDWWQKSVFYEIYPRSFMDTTGNGVGDLRGK